MTAPTVLLVEDNPDDVLLVRRAIRRSGVELDLHVASDGDQALRYLDGEGEHADRARFPLPALVLLDWKLPRRSGLEVLQHVRAQPALDAVPVVVLTSSAQDEDVRRAYAARANSYLQKPVSLEALTGLLGTAGTYWLRHNVVAT